MNEENLVAVYEWAEKNERKVPDAQAYIAFLEAKGALDEAVGHFAKNKCGAMRMLDRLERDWFKARDRLAQGLIQKYEPQIFEW